MVFIYANRTASEVSVSGTNYNHLFNYPASIDLDGYTKGYHAYSDPKGTIVLLDTRMTRPTLKYIQELDKKSILRQFQFKQKKTEPLFPNSDEIKYSLATQIGPHLWVHHPVLIHDFLGKKENIRQSRLWSITKEYHNFGPPYFDNISLDFTDRYCFIPVNSSHLIIFGIVRSSMELQLNPVRETMLLDFKSQKYEWFAKKHTPFIDLDPWDKCEGFATFAKNGQRIAWIHLQRGNFDVSDVMSYNLDLGLDKDWTIHGKGIHSSGRLSKRNCGMID